ncbi:MAG TPA: helix-turn-helix transcriptional regulator [Kofleriaceae bacterium]
MTRTDGGRDLTSNVALAAASVVMTALVAIDLATDAGSGTTALHVLVEGAMIAIGVVATVRLALRVRELTREARELREHARELTADLDASRQEAARWRRDAGDLIAGLGAAIDQQLEHWGLSPAEKAVALLLLKGLSHKEIAVIREVNETTVRQQARAIYRKAGLSGRNDLAAFFLEDLLGPHEGRAAPATTSGSAAGSR